MLIELEQEVDRVEVVLLTGVPKTLTYGVTGEWLDSISVGMLVRVPLLNRRVLGVVVRMGSDQKIPKGRLKNVIECLYETPVMTEDLVKLALWLHRYYAASMESVFESMVPAVVRQGMQAKEVKYLKLAKELEEGDLAKLIKRAPKQAAVYEYLKMRDVAVLKSKVLAESEGGASAAKSLVDKGIVEEILEVEQRVAYQDSLAGAEVLESGGKTLMDEQAVAVDDIAKSIDDGEFQVHLLHGVTGSGKTEVFLQAIGKVLEEGGSVLFLVPEVALTPQTVGRLRARLESRGLHPIVWHSQLSAGERFDAWMSMARGEARVVVGARSAVFAPLKNLRLIVVDEEHEPAYKQGEVPRYHGRDVAVYRAWLCKAVCILGSATPSLESLANVESKGYKLNKLTKRVDDRQLPLVHVVDMKPEVISAKKPVTLSRVLVDKLRDRFEQKEQSILFINRRGYSSKMLCLECSHVAECNHCSVTLTYHKFDGMLKCHICGHQERAPKSCPQCGSVKIKWGGSGTQKVEDVVEKAVKGAKVVRMDADTMSKKNLFREILADFRKGKIDILIGTQMIAKGLDFPNVTLVGLIDADISLHVQDFRAAERTFQLVVQVAGRAGRGDRAGEVIVQSFIPHSAPIQFARRGDFDGFLEGELEMRKECNYPPYRHIIRHIFRGKDRLKVEAWAESWANYLEKNLNTKVELRGPAPAPLERIKDYYRYHLWFFVGNVSKMIPEIMNLRRQFKSDKDVIDVFDIDPVDMT